MLLKNFKGAYRSFPFIIALDGEREIEVNRPGQFDLTLGLNGSRVVRIPRGMREALEKAVFPDWRKMEKGRRSWS